MSKQEEKSAQISDVVKIYLKTAFHYKWGLFFVIVFFSLAVFVQSVFPWILRELFNLLEESSFTDRTTIWRDILGIISLLAIAKAIEFCLWRIGGTINNRWQPAVITQLDRVAIDAILAKSHRFFTDNFTGALIKKVGRFNRGFERIADEITFRFLPVLIISTSATVGLYSRKPILALIFISWVIVFIIFSIFASRYAASFDVARNKVESKVGATLSDIISNMSTVRLFSASQFERKNYFSLIEKWRALATKSWDTHEKIFAVQGILALTLEFSLLILALHYWTISELGLGDIVLIQSLIALLLGNVHGLARSIKHFTDAYADGKELVDIMIQDVEVADLEQAEILDVTIGEISFNNVTFAFEDDAILENFSLRIAPKQKLALVGPSGAGKSTVTKLLLRYFDTQEGSVTIDGQDIRSVTQASLNRAISVVSQEPMLFHRSLLENIRYGKPNASLEEVITASKQAHCHEFISKLPKGYETEVGERGIKLSGGERQRVALARAILKNAPILILDEATSALDSESESLIQDALEHLMKNKTVIVIAHRLSTIMKMDRIIVMENGVISADGQHGQLIKTTGTYKKLWDIQVGSFGG
jgi:ATP-binding cassette subfamily B protein